MTQAELHKELKSLGLPFAYSHFKVGKAKEPPFITYLFLGSEDFMADNMNYKKVGYYAIELYTDFKDFANEKLVEDKLMDLEIPYDKSETWIESEKIYQVYYEIELI